MSEQNAGEKSPYQLDMAELQWQDGDIPTASQFNDIYYSGLRGLDESRHVFLQHNQLAQRWQQLKDGSHFTIAETGFGTGLNFLAAWQLWQQQAPKNARLHFISVEKHPLKREELGRALSIWPELQEIADQLIDQYPILTPGQHYLTFEQGSVTLTLLMGDAKTSLEQLRDSDHAQWRQLRSFQIDAWFLDGFAPSRNPDLWNDTIYTLLADLSCDQTTLSTFTAVGSVRRALTDHGFRIEKVKGFGKKREMMKGIFGDRPTPSQDQQHPAPGIKAPWYVNRDGGNQIHHSKHIAIIGGGLAGVTSAYAMAQRGWQVTLVERQHQLAEGASGNSQGMLYTKLSPKTGTLNQFTMASYLYALRYYKQWQYRDAVPGDQLDFCGLLQLASTDKERQLIPQLQHAFAGQPDLVQCLSQQQASEVAGVDVGNPGWFFPGAGWLSPSYLCRSLAEHPRINVIRYTEVLDIEFSDNNWQLKGADNQPIATAAAVIIANGRDAVQFQQTSHLPVKTIRGQVTLLNSNYTHSNLNTVICHEGYITPASNGQHSLGATFDNGDTDISLRAYDHQRNLKSLEDAIPMLFKQPASSIDASILEGRAGLRCTSPDYLPLVGPAHNYSRFIDDYGVLRKNAHQNIATAGCYHPNLYLNIAHGSRGITSTPLCSELLASLVCGEPHPLPRNLMTALNPARFIIRDLVRNKI
ncbi:MAG: bifunctional tRNA (5-methylaminomethyl-2-thiouridine)(34)-methyltransferase MnmD/FAD-dependent 5-carboxymethylaminomethyl-2-thiouridine(34) oxidoreductase MnmC [Oceanicoccus sp.]